MNYFIIFPTIRVREGRGFFSSKDLNIKVNSHSINSYSDFQVLFKWSRNSDWSTTTSSIKEVLRGIFIEGQMIYIVEKLPRYLHATKVGNSFSGMHQLQTSSKMVLRNSNLQKRLKRKRNLGRSLRIKRSQKMSCRDQVTQKKNCTLVPMVTCIQKPSM